MYRSALQFSLILILLLLAGSPLFSQDLKALNQTRLKTNQVGLGVLGAWAMGNLVFSGIKSTQLTGELGYFHQMNFFWNTVNISLAGFGLYQAFNTDPSALNFYNTLQEQQSIEKLLLLNTGLDVGYIASGLYLMERARRSETRSAMLSGYGKSLILQGGFLFVFDLSFYLAHHIRSENLRDLLQHVQPASSGLGLMLTF